MRGVASEKSNQKLKPIAAGGSLTGDELSEQISGALASALPISCREIAEEFVVTPAEDADGFFLAERVDVQKNG